MSTNKMIRIMLLDDHLLMLHGLELSLRAQPSHPHLQYQDR